MNNIVGKKVILYNSLIIYIPVNIDVSLNMKSMKLIFHVPKHWCLQNFHGGS